MTHRNEDKMASHQSAYLPIDSLGRAAKAIMDVRQRGTGVVGASDGGGPQSSQPRLRRTLSDSKNARGTSRGLASTCLVGVFLTAVVALGVMAGSVFFVSSFDGRTVVAVHASPPSVRGMKENEVQKEDRVDRKLYEALQEKNRALQEQLINIKKQQPAVDSTAKLPAAPADQDKLIKTVARLTQYRTRMQEMIKLISKRSLLDKYGKSPHYVEILVSFDPGSNVADSNKAGGDDTDVLLIQLAPVDEMPATVFWFLEQVNATVYDGCSFHRNAGHVVQGGPAPNFETVDGGKSVMQKIKATQLNSVPFQE